MQNTIQNKTKSSVIYRGASLIDGAPIVVIASVGSKNSKTGGMVQTYIIREDIDPREASKTGADFSICGSCPHRGEAHDDPAKKLAKGRTCYVEIGKSVLNVWRTYHRGSYAVADDPVTRELIGSGRMVRLGAYGDPAAVPAYVWQQLTAAAKSHTGYSHQFKESFAESDSLNLCMVSADSVKEAADFQARGYRTFRIIPINEWRANERGALLESEILCPATKEAGQLTQCADCGLCGGVTGKSKAAKSIAVVAHGANGAAIQ